MFTESFPVNLHLATAEGSWHWYGPENGVPYALVCQWGHCMTPGTQLLFSSRQQEKPWHDTDRTHVHLW